MGDGSERSTWESVGCVGWGVFVCIAVTLVQGDETGSRESPPMGILRSGT